MQISSGASQGSPFPPGNVGERLLAVPGEPDWPGHVACWAGLLPRPADWLPSLTLGLPERALPLDLDSWLNLTTIPCLLQRGCDWQSPCLVTQHPSQLPTPQGYGIIRKIAPQRTWEMERIDEQKCLVRALWGKNDSQTYSRLLMITLKKVIVFGRFANQC